MLNGLVNHFIVKGERDKACLELGWREVNTPRHHIPKETGEASSVRLLCTGVIVHWLFRKVQAEHRSDAYYLCVGSRIVYCLGNPLTETLALLLKFFVLSRFM